MKKSIHVKTTRGKKKERATPTHRVASVLDLFTLSNEVSKNVGALLLRLERNALALLEASRTVLEDGSAG
jgi:hypothetical protein